MTPRNHLLAMVLACLLAVAAGTQAVAWWAARAAQSSVVAQRDGYLLHSLRTAAENYLAIGLNLDQMEALQGLIERERAGFSEVLAIDVFNASGTVLYSTDPNALGSLTPQRWNENLAGPAAAWQSDDAGQRQLGVRFDNDLGEAAGGIVLTVSTAPKALTLAQWQANGHTALKILAALILAGLAAWAGAALGVRHLLKPYTRVARILQGQTSAAAPAPASTEQDAAAQQTRAAWSAAQQQAHNRLRQLEALDDV